MATAYEVNANELIEKTAAQLKQQQLVQPPEWAQFAKTGMHKEKPPMDKEWWYVRSAAILRTIYKIGPIGVSKIRTKYGGKKNRGMRPEATYKGSGSIARKILQQLEKSELIKQGQAGIHKGRIITPKGKSFLDKVASTLYEKKELKPVKEGPKKADEKPEPQAETKSEQKPEKKPEPKKEAKEVSPEPKKAPDNA